MQEGGHLLGEAVKSEPRERSGGGGGARGALWLYAFLRPLCMCSGLLFCVLCLYVYMYYTTGNPRYDEGLDLELSVWSTC